MSEENKWGTDLPDEDKNASAEQKPLTHPYSEGRRMQESGQDSYAGAGQSEGASQEKPQYGHYEVHQPQAGNYAGGNIPPKKPRKKRDFAGNNSFGKKAATAVALAVIFGLVAGVVFQGVNIAADKYRGNDSSTTIGKTETVTGTEDSTDSDSADSTVKDIVAESGTVAGVAQATMSSIVAITSVSVQEIPSFFGYGTRQYQSAGSGSGIIVGENDSELLIATNNHVVSGAESLTVCFNDNKDAVFDAKIKGTDPNNDLAVIAIQLSDISEDVLNSISIATLGDSTQMEVGDQVVAIGNALGFGQSVTTGIISAVDREVTIDDTTATLLQTDAAINPGNSGGALFNMKGEVIGINEAKYADTSVEGVGYAIPISKAKDIIDDLMTRTTKIAVSESEQGYLGIQLQNIDESMAKMYGMPQGVYVYKIMEDSAAAGSDLHEKDIITKLDGEKISNYADLAKLLTYYKSGDTVTLTVQSLVNGSYQEREVQVTLKQRPAESDSENSQSQGGQQDQKPAQSQSKIGK